VPDGHCGRIVGNSSPTMSQITGTSEDSPMVRVGGYTTTINHPRFSVRVSSFASFDTAKSKPHQ
jgi:hypothetical protein